MMSRSCARAPRWRRLALAGLGAGLAAAPALAPPAAAASPAAVPIGAPAAAPRSQSGAADADPVTKWSVAPSRTAESTGRSWFTYDLAPGTELVDRVAVTNLGDTTMDFQVYPTDAYTTEDGAFALLPEAEQVRGAGSWITLEAGQYRVPAGHQLDIPFRVAVPDNASPGDHAGGIVAAVTSRQSNHQGQVVDLDQRVAARVYLRVDGPAQPAVRVESVQVSYRNPIVPWGRHTMTVSYLLRNTGNLRITGGSAQVAVTAPFGWRLAGADPAPLPELLPGSTVAVTETVTGVAPVFRLTAQVEVAAHSTDGQVPPVRRTAAVWALPWLLLAVVLAGAAWYGVRRWRRRRAA